jgi:hypothetical protein
MCCVLTGGRTASFSTPITSVTGSCEPTMPRTSEPAACDRSGIAASTRRSASAVVSDDAEEGSTAPDVFLG